MVPVADGGGVVFHKLHSIFQSINTSQRLRELPREL